MMRRFAESVPLRLGLIAVIGIVAQFVTHASWLAIAVLVTYFAAKEIVGAVQRPGAAGALLAGESGRRIAAIACDNGAFFAAILGFFTLQNAALADGGTVARFAAFEAVVIVLVVAWGMIGAAALRRSLGPIKV